MQGGDADCLCVLVEMSLLVKVRAEPRLEGGQGVQRGNCQGKSTPKQKNCEEVHVTGPGDEGALGLQMRLKGSGKPEHYRLGSSVWGLGFYRGSGKHSGLSHGLTYIYTDSSGCCVENRP